MLKEGKIAFLSSLKWTTLENVANYLLSDVTRPGRSRNRRSEKSRRPPQCAAGIKFYNRPMQNSTFCNRICCDRSLEVVNLHARDQADVFQDGQLLLGSGRVPIRSPVTSAPRIAAPPGFLDVRYPRFWLNLGACRNTRMLSCDRPRHSQPWQFPRTFDSGWASA